MKKRQEQLFLSENCANKRMAGGGISLEARVGVGPAGWQQREGSQVVLGSITMNKASGGHGISVELFQILKADAVKVLHSICQQIWKTQQWPQDWKRYIFIPIPKKGNAKECSNYRTIALISHTSKVMFKILQASAIHELRPSRCSSWF